MICLPGYSILKLFKMCRRDSDSHKVMSWVVDMTSAATFGLTSASHEAHVAGLPFFASLLIPFLSSYVPLLFCLLQAGTL